MRPAAHFTAVRGWINDPYGTWYDGDRYHRYFQAIPDSTRWSPRCVWGHATSTDLVEWHEQPAVLVPGADEAGCWSGDVVVEQDEPVAYYTRVHDGRLDLGEIVRVALGPDGATAAAHREPVITGPPDGLAVIAFRDPFVARDGDGDRMLVGGGLADGDGCVLQYRRAGGGEWRYDGILLRGRLGKSAQVWECPQLARTGEWELLVVSAEPGGVIATVRHRNSAFGAWQGFVRGPSAYATSLFLDRDERLCAVSWLRGIPHDNSDPWAGAHSLPALVAVNADGRTRVEPHPALLAGDAFAPVSSVTRAETDRPVRTTVGRGSDTAHVFVDGEVVEVFAGGRHGVWPRPR